MTTITIDEDIKLPIERFKTYDDLVDFVIQNNVGFEVEDLTKDEEDFINSLESFQNFKEVANKIGK